MKKLKVVTIGGGSSYTPELIDGFIKRHKELPVTDYYLVDIDEGREKLEIVGNLAKRMVEKANIPMKIHLTTDRREALKDADFVTTQFRVGQLDARIHDEKIPLKYNVLGQETTGPGGFMKALRTIPVILDICKDMEELCPNAFLINFTNPAGIVTEAIIKNSKVKSIGICSGANTMMMDVAKAYGVAKEDVYMNIIGLNHLICADEIYVKSQDVTNDFMSKLTQQKEALANIPDIGFEEAFTKAMGMYPIGYLKYYWLQTEMVEEAKNIAAEVGTRGEQTKKIEQELFEIYKNEDLKEKPKQLELRGGAFYSDTACSIISSIYNDKKEVHVANVRNNGTYLDLPENVTIEHNCVIDSQGAHPIAYGHLPLKFRGLVQAVKSYEELTVEAALTGDFDTALLALNANPIVPSSSNAKLMLEELLLANKGLLPQFANYFEGK